MNSVNSKNGLIEIIQNAKISIVYFSGTSCGACEVIKMKIEGILTEYKNIKAVEVNGVMHVELASEYSIFSLPILLLFIEGKEALRVGRYFDVLEFHNIINRYYEMLFN